jgi:hypothetical protein
MAIKLGKKRAMEKQGKKGGDGKIRREGGNDRTKNTKSEE